MPSSSSTSGSDYLVATSDLDDDTGTGVLPRSADAEGYVSFLRTQDEVDAVCRKYNISKDQHAARPAGGLRACSPPPPGFACVYAHALEAGMRVPLHPFFAEALAHFGIAPAQLAPNAWRVMAGFLALCRSTGVRPSLAVFGRFFTLSVLNHKHTKRWYYFMTRSKDSSGLRFTGLPVSISDWKRGFFFLSSPTPWPCPVEWGEPSKTSLMEPVLSNEEKESAAKLLRAYGGAAVDIKTCLGESNLAASVVSAASPPPPSGSSKGMDSSVYNMMKTLLAEKMASQASASAKKVKPEQGPSLLCGKKRNLVEANGEEGRAPGTPPAAHGYSMPGGVCSPLPGFSREPQDFADGHDGDGTGWEAARELLQSAVAPPQQRMFAANEQSDVVTSSYVAILRAANYVSFSLSYALELEKKLMERDAEVAALREQLGETEGKLAAAKVAAEHARWKGEDGRRAARRT